MDHKKPTHLRLVADNQPNLELDSVAARIHPLPQEVAPSEEFLSRTRLRLLQLERRVAGHSRRAA